MASTGPKKNSRKNSRNNHEVSSTPLFDEQFDELSKDAKKRIHDKLDLLRQNPYRYKRLVAEDATLFRIRLSDNNKELRVIYTIHNNTVILLFILERANDYKDLQRYLDKIND